MAKFTHSTFLVRAYWALCFWVGICVTTNHQVSAQASLDELLVQLKKPMPDSEKLLLYNGLSRGYLEYNLSDSAVYFAKEAIALAEKTGIKKEYALANLYLAQAYYSQQAYELADKAYVNVLGIAEASSLSSIVLSALEERASLANQVDNTNAAKKYLLSANKLCKSLNDTAATIRVRNQLATIYHASGALDSAIFYFESLIEIKTAKKDTVGMISDFSELGGLLLDQGEYAQAQKYFFDARNLGEVSKDSMLLMGLYAEIGKIYLDHQQWEIGREYAQQAATIASRKEVKYTEGMSYQYMGEALAALGEIDAAQQAYSKSLMIFQSLNNDIEIAKNYIAIGRLLEEEEEITEALPFLEKALELYQRLGDKLNTMEVNITLASIYLGLNKLPLSIKYAQDGERLAREMSSFSGLQQSSKILADVYERAGNYSKAYAYHVLYNQYKDSIFNSENAERILELEAKYESERKDRILAEREATIAKNNQLLLEKTYQSYFLFGGLLILVLALGFLFYSFQKRQELHKQNIAILKKEQEAANLRAVIAGEEQERKRVAAELHDGLGATLVSAKMMFDAVENELPDVKNTSTYRQANILLDGACDEVREISHNLMPSMLEHHGLEETVKELCAVLNKSQQLEVDFIPFGLDDTIDDTIQVSIYRIVQELLKNIIKHAEAEEAIVQLTQEDGNLSLIVEDDGKGFVLSKMNDKAGIGLDSIRSRVAYLQGSCEIDTREREGTTFHIQIPLETQTSP